MTRETVDIETPASFATFRILMILTPLQKTNHSGFCTCQIIIPKLFKQILMARYCAVSRLEYKDINDYALSLGLRLSES